MIAGKQDRSTSRLREGSLGALRFVWRTHASVFGARALVWGGQPGSEPESGCRRLPLHIEMASGVDLKARPPYLEAVGTDAKHIGLKGKSGEAPLGGNSGTAPQR